MAVQVKKRISQNITEIPRGRRRLYYGLTFALPFLLLILAEAALRLFGYGNDLSLFNVEILNGKPYHVLNPETKLRYFSHLQFRPSISPDYFQVPKQKGTYRIFCLGGSTTVGYPYWYNGSFSMFLKKRFQNIFPEKSFEIINMGMTATNSYTVNDMAEELTGYEPDLFVVYDGHNEFYGALGISSNETLGKFRWLTKSTLKLVHLRTFQLLRNGYVWITGLFRGPGQVQGGTLMENLAQGQYIPFRSKTYSECLDIFKANLEDLRDICRRKKIPVILATQVSNLRDQPPFISQEPEHSALKERLLKEYELGVAQMDKGEIGQAVDHFRRALTADSLHAGAHYMLARCLDSLGDKLQALSEYRKARDYDMLRFRTSSDFNNAIRSASDGSGMITVDMEKIFQDNSPDSLIGRELIFEHLHPNSKGFFIMAKEYALAMREHGMLASTGEWVARDTLSDEKLWAERSLTDLDELIARRRTEVLTSGWPFKSQVPIVDAVRKKDTLGQIVEQVTRGKWLWTKAHEAAADYYSGRREYEKAEKEYRVVIDQYPFLEVQVYLRFAKLLLDQGKTNELREVLLSSLDIQPTILAYRALGDIALNSGKPLEASKYYENVLNMEKSPAEQVENGYLLATAYWRAGSPEKAVTQLMFVLKIKPDYMPAVTLLNKIKTGH